MATTTLTLLLLAVVLHTTTAAAGVLQRARRIAESPNAAAVNSSCGAATVQNFYMHPTTGDSPARGEQGEQGPPGPAGPQGSQGNTGPPGPTAGGATYIRWGRDDCPSTPGTELLYSGMAGGSYYNQGGGGSNYLCLPNNPQYLDYASGVSGYRAYVYGAEYQTYGDISDFGGMHNHNVPCAVCYTPTRGTKIMIPARTDCPSSWTREYYGYLMANRYNYARSPPFECVDVNPESLPGSVTNTDGALFYFTESRCNGICPPYTDGRELTCTVCTK